MIIKKEISEKVLMVGVHFRENATGGMATVIQNYDASIEDLRYVTTWKPSNAIVKLFIAVVAYIKIFFLLLFDKKIEIVHIHGAAYGSFYRKKIVIDMSKFFKKKVIYHMHGGEFKHFFGENKNKEDIIKTINSCDVCLVLSGSWKEYFVSIGVAPEKILILNNSIPLPSKREVNEVNGNSDILNLLFLGTLVKEKGIFDLLDVVIEDKEYFRKHTRLVIGGNRNEDKIKSIISKENIGDFVIFKGWISGIKKEEEFNIADLLILPSYFEALPMVILEAMSFDCAVLATDVGGIPDIIENGTNGELIQAGAKAELKNTLAKLISDKNIILDYKRMGKETAKSFYPDIVFGKLNDIYVRLLSSI